MKFKDLKIGDVFCFKDDIEPPHRFRKESETYCSSFYEGSWSSYSTIFLFPNDELILLEPAKMFFKDLKIDDCFICDDDEDSTSLFRKISTDCYQCSWDNGKNWVGGLSCKWSWPKKVVVPTNRMNIIEAFVAMRQGKKVHCLDDSYEQAEYLYMKEDGGIFDQCNCSVTIDLIGNLLDKEWEEYRPSLEVEVKLNDEHTAKVSAKGIKVGCQLFDLDKVEELANAVKKVKESN